MALVESENLLARDDDGYELARRDAVWNGLKPHRYPSAIVLAESEQDVVDAVRYAADHGLKVKARSGGHSWTASSVRDGALLIDLSRMNDVAFDASTGIARVGPGARGRDLNGLLAEHNLFFPSGHCPTVGLGGFLLQGGWGWLSRKIGPACMSVVAVDVVTADGSVIHADEHQNTEWLWAARGAGAGYFGVVTRFHLRCHERPAAIWETHHVYPMEVRDQVLRWALEEEPSFPDELEFAIMATTPRGPLGEVVPGPPALIVMCSVMSDSDEEAQAALALLDGCPVRSRAAVALPAQSRSFVELYDGPDSVEPEGFHWSADGMWTNAGPDELVPAVAELYDTIPEGASHVFWYAWREQALPDAAISVQGTLYLAAFGGWTDPAESEAMLAWPADQMRRLEPLSRGIQLADENLVRRPARYLIDENAARLEELRARFDPEGRFLSYLMPDEWTGVAP
ncbi:MAG TPA: FAD-binding oxidoreductase [Solirubrobacteraceae bacterium]|nr:FAD-binding oxidoreductase [Solirubrobacteraceae bacterium]